jgi:hypothetical protein
VRAAGSEISDALAGFRRYGTTPEPVRGILDRARSALGAADKAELVADRLGRSRIMVAKMGQDGTIAAPIWSHPPSPFGLRSGVGALFRPARPPESGRARSMSSALRRWRRAQALIPS